MGAVGRELEHGALIRCAAGAGRSIEVAGAVEHEVADPGPALAGVEAVEEGEGAVRGDLENSTVAWIAPFPALSRGAVQIAAAIAGEASHRIHPLEQRAERMED